MITIDQIDTPKPNIERQRNERQERLAQRAIMGDEQSDAQRPQNAPFCAPLQELVTRCSNWLGRVWCYLTHSTRPHQMER